MFRASSAYLQEDTVVRMQQLYPPEDEHLRLETCTGE